MHRTQPLERILHSQGFGSRKVCRQIIRAGRVYVGADRLEDPFRELSLQDLEFSVDGQAWTYREKAYVLLHKPAGFECSRAPRNHPGVLSLLPPPLQLRGVQPVGRLDVDTTGLLLLTDDGAFIHRLISPRYGISKVYVVTTKHPISEEQVQALLQGVVLHDAPEPVAALTCVPVEPHSLRMTLREGRYHQVKRMLAAVGNRVEGLVRVEVGGLSLPSDLAAGAWRWLTPEEVDLVQSARDTPHK